MNLMYTTIESYPESVAKFHIATATSGIPQRSDFIGEVYF